MKSKSFDCVAMKQQVQRELRRRYAGKSWKERNGLVREALRKDAHLSKLLQAFGETKGAHRAS